MTNDQALALIKSKMGGEDSDERNSVAVAALSVAIDSACGLGQFWWNSIGTTFSLTTGTGEYLFDDLISDYEVYGIHPHLWFTTKQLRCDIISNDDFNDAYRHRMTSGGEPRFATLHGLDKTIEFWPNPGSDYELWGLLWVAIDGIDAIPKLHHGSIIARAVMFAVGSDHPNYGWARGEWSEGVDRILADTRLEMWRGTRAAPDIYAVGSSLRLVNYPSSSNLTGIR